MVTPSLIIPKITLSEVSFSQLPYCAWILPKALEESADITHVLPLFIGVPLLPGVGWFPRSGALI